MSAAERVYRALLRAYPTAFRAEYGREMALTFRDLRREPGARGLRFWPDLVWDVARSALALRVDALRARLGDFIHFKEGSVKTMSILAIVIGVYESVGAAAEWWGGGMRGYTAYWQVTAGLVVVAGALLVAGGVALLRRGRGATTLARNAATGCLAIFLVISFLPSWMAIFGRILGVVFPIALLIFLHRRPRPALGASALLLALTLPSGVSAQTQVRDTTQSAAVVKDLPLSTAQRAAVAGKYVVTLPHGPRVTFRIFEENGVLIGQPDGEPGKRLLHQGNNVFLVEGVPDFSFAFHVENGRATKLTLRKEDGTGEGVRIP